MPISPVGSSKRGITLVEMVIVMAIVGLVAGITYPTVANGLESVHLASASDTVAAFLNTAVNRVERRQVIVELLISVKDSSVLMHSTEAGFERKLELPDGITITAVLPAVPDQDPNTPRAVMLIPGGTAPRIGIEIRNRKGNRRIVRVDPMTGVPRIEIPPEVR